MITLKLKFSRFKTDKKTAGTIIQLKFLNLENPFVKDEMMTKTLANILKRDMSMPKNLNDKTFIG